MSEPAEGCAWEAQATEQQHHQPAVDADRHEQQLPPALCAGQQLQLEAVHCHSQQQEQQQALVADQQQPSAGAAHQWQQPQQQQQQQQQRQLLAEQQQRVPAVHDQQHSLALDTGHEQEHQLTDTAPPSAADAVADAGQPGMQQRSGSTVSRTTNTPSQYERASANIMGRFKSLKSGLHKLVDTTLRDLQGLLDHPRVLFGGRARGVLVMSLPLGTRNAQVVLAGCDDMDEPTREAVLQTATQLARLLEVTNHCRAAREGVLATNADIASRIPGLAAQHGSTRRRASSQQRRRAAGRRAVSESDSSYEEHTAGEEEEEEQQQQRRRRQCSRRRRNKGRQRAVRSSKSDRYQRLSRRVWAVLTRAGLAPAAGQQCASGSCGQWRECEKYVTYQQYDGSYTCRCGGSCMKARSELGWTPELPLVNPNKVSYDSRAIHMLLRWVRSRQEPQRDGWPHREMAMLLEEHLEIQYEKEPAEDSSSGATQTPPPEDAGVPSDTELQLSASAGGDAGQPAGGGTAAAAAAATAAAVGAEAAASRSVTGGGSVAAGHAASGAAGGVAGAAHARVATDGAIAAAGGAAGGGGGAVTQPALWVADSSRTGVDRAAPTGGCAGDSAAAAQRAAASRAALKHAAPQRAAASGRAAAAAAAGQGGGGGGGDAGGGDAGSGSSGDGPTAVAAALPGACVPGCSLPSSTRPATRSLELHQGVQRVQHLSLAAAAAAALSSDPPDDVMACGFGAFPKVALQVQDPNSSQPRAEAWSPVLEPPVPTLDVRTVRSAAPPSAAAAATAAAAEGASAATASAASAAAAAHGSSSGGPLPSNQNPFIRHWRTADLGQHDADPKPTRMQGHPPPQQQHQQQQGSWLSSLVKGAISRVSQCVTVQQAQPPAAAFPVQAVGAGADAAGSVIAGAALVMEPVIAAAPEAAAEAAADAADEPAGKASSARAGAGSTRKEQANLLYKVDAMRPLLEVEQPTVVKKQRNTTTGRSDLGHAKRFVHFATDPETRYYVPTPPQPQAKQRQQRAARAVKPDMPAPGQAGEGARRSARLSGTTTVVPGYPPARNPTSSIAGGKRVADPPSSGRPAKAARCAAAQQQQQQQHQQAGGAEQPQQQVEQQLKQQPAHMQQQQQQGSRLAIFKQLLHQLLDKQQAAALPDSATAVELLEAAGTMWDAEEFIAFIEQQPADRVLMSLTAVGLDSRQCPFVVDVTVWDVALMVASCEATVDGQAWAPPQQLLQGGRFGRAQPTQPRQVASNLCEVLAYIITGDDRSVLLLPNLIAGRLRLWQEKNDQSALVEVKYKISGYMAAEVPAAGSVFCYRSIFCLVNSGSHWMLTQVQPQQGKIVGYDSCWPGRHRADGSGAAAAAAAEEARVTRKGYMLLPFLTWLEDERMSCDKPASEQHAELHDHYITKWQRLEKRQLYVRHPPPPSVQWSGALSFPDVCSVANVPQQAARDSFSCGVHALGNLLEVVQQGVVNPRTRLADRQQLVFGLVRGLVSLGLAVEDGVVQLPG